MRIVKLPDGLKSVVRRYGGAPVVRRTYRESSRRVRALQRVAGGAMGGVGLVWNPRGQAVLVRHDPVTGWGPEWVAPGGMTEPGEGPEATFVREVREETGLSVARILDLTVVFDLTATDGTRSARGFVFQFEGWAPEGEPEPGEGIREAAWFDALPEDMAFREDYEEAFRRRRGTFRTP